ncbi:MAG: SDR family oxidoreductase [Chitinophagaceae bacterium]|nr:SDR family oxidoreductase [Chitinophagaceae bacterium]
MKIVVIGGTGLIGTRLVSKLIRLDHTVIAASPTSGIDTITGEGLHDALKGTDVVVDVSNSPASDPASASTFFKTSTINLISAELYGGVKHHIALSVVGAERLPESGYLRAKLEQEDLIKESGIPFTILRSTQFFELAGRIAAAATTGEEVHISPAAFQPVAADEVVDVLAEIVLRPPLNDTIEVAGPVAMPMDEFIRYYLNATEDSHQLISDEHARYFGAELNDNSLVPGENAHLGKIHYEHWFNEQLTQSWT